MAQIPARSFAAVDQQYSSVTQMLDMMLEVMQQQVAAEKDIAAAWSGTVQVSLAEAKKDPDYLDNIIQLAVAAFIRLAKQ